MSCARLQSNVRIGQRDKTTADVAAAMVTALVQAYLQALLLSAKSAADVAGLRERIVEFFEREMRATDAVTCPLCKDA